MSFVLFLLGFISASYNVYYENEGKIAQQVIDTLPSMPCSNLLYLNNSEDSIYLHYDTLDFNNKKLLFIIKEDSTFSVYENKQGECILIFKKIINYADIGTGVQESRSALLLIDINGDTQKEILIQTYKNRANGRFMGYHLVSENMGIKLIPISRFEDLYSPYYDPKTKLIVSEIVEKSFHSQEYFSIDKNFNLKFVKGTKSTKFIDEDGESIFKEEKYIHKEGW